ncbi:tetratricopeptide repeat protein [Candidatus Kirkpatrickella diaphorinae]|uniref:Tetratricopeptide repeat protein n=1 Tax=Candidatus Kirkpatrickella diaphorinae TaxID=2984322 RepID=A0ABY6GIH7_9PROT|nr:tetratricopeptide repeat protein [Candidatus Kirkpatrickella diaphorinae]UYH50578.1 tetratricopeptide repeat protein [Candidatus Kirkpatrickella diaphorinae]
MDRSHENLPTLNCNQHTEDTAVSAFRELVIESRVFNFQGSDEHDYGCDAHIEAIDRNHVTNARIQVQIKGTAAALNADGSLSISIKVSAFTYLLQQPSSVLVAYHIPTKRMLYSLADEVQRDLGKSNPTWKQQQTVTIKFRHELTVSALERWASKVIASTRASRVEHLRQSSLHEKPSPERLLPHSSFFFVSSDPEEALSQVLHLFKEGADDIISANFEQFRAVFGNDSDYMITCYKSEINLGLDKKCSDEERIRAAIEFFRTRLNKDGHVDYDVYYTIGNAYDALGEAVSAKEAFEEALTSSLKAGNGRVSALIAKNIGSFHERQGNVEQAITFNEKALEYDPYLPEALYSLARLRFIENRYDEALKLLDNITYEPRLAERMISAQLLRAEIFFKKENYSSAFREINSILSQDGCSLARKTNCCKLVIAHTSSCPEYLRCADDFWTKYFRAHHGFNEISVGPMSRLAHFVVRLELHRTQEKSLGDRASFIESLRTFADELDAENAAAAWDQLGHWALEDEDFSDAALCFHRAYQLAGAEYGLCLAYALTQSQRFEESAPYWAEQADLNPLEEAVWMRLAEAYFKIGHWQKSIDALKRAFEINPKNPAAIILEGSALWNSGDVAAAIQTWVKALSRFPNAKFNPFAEPATNPLENSRYNSVSGEEK